MNMGGMGSGGSGAGAASIASLGLSVFSSIQKGQGAKAANDFQAARGGGFHQVTRQLGLAIDSDVPASEGGDRHADQPLSIGEVETFFEQAMRIEALIKTQAVQQVGGHRFQHARANPAKDVFGCPAFEDDAIDAGGAQQMAKQQARGSTADDDHGSFHLGPPADCHFAHRDQHPTSCSSSAPRTR